MRKLRGNTIMRDLLKNKLAVTIILSLICLSSWLFTYFVYMTEFRYGLLYLMYVIDIILAIVTVVWYLYLVIIRFKTVDFIKLVIGADIMIFIPVILLSVWDLFISDDPWHGLIAVTLGLTFAIALSILLMICLVYQRHKEKVS